MSPRRALVPAAAVAALAGCTLLAPYPTAPALPPIGAPPGPRVAICYNTLHTALAAVRAAAQQECPAGTSAEPERTDWYLDFCPLALPARATFRCAPASAPPTGSAARESDPRPAR